MTLSQLHRLYSVEWEDYYEWWNGIDMERGGRDLFSGISEFFGGRTEQNYEKLSFVVRYKCSTIIFGLNALPSVARSVSNEFIWQREKYVKIMTAVLYEQRKENPPQLSICGNEINV